MNTDTSPILKDNRIEDITAAIQFMARYERASNLAAEWEKRLEPPQSAKDWMTIFSEHPGFFRVSCDKYISLRSRHGYQKIYDVSQRRELSAEELKTRDGKTLSRKPLEDPHIAVLIEMAMQSKDQAATQVITQQQEERAQRQEERSERLETEKFGLEKDKLRLEKGRNWLTTAALILSVITSITTFYVTRR